jgi:hypothetical protein
VDEGGYGRVDEGGYGRVDEGGYGRVDEGGYGREVWQEQHDRKNTLKLDRSWLHWCDEQNKTVQLGAVAPPE